MPILVLDDQLAARDEKGHLPAGRNRSESMFELLKAEGFDAVLYDGRGKDGVSELQKGRFAAMELVRRLVEEYPGTSEELPLPCNVILDLKWFDDEDYGRELLAALMEDRSVIVGKVVVWSVITDRVVRRKFFEQFEVPPEQVLDRGVTPESRILSLFR